MALTFISLPAASKTWITLPPLPSSHAHFLIDNASHLCAWVDPSDPTLTAHAFIAFNFSPSNRHLSLQWIQSSHPHTGLASSLITQLITSSRALHVHCTSFTPQGALLLEHKIRSLCASLHIPLSID